LTQGNIAMRHFVLGLFALIGIVTVLLFIGVGVAVWRITQPAFLLNRSC